jgi:hypothetical protein
MQFAWPIHLILLAVCCLVPFGRLVWLERNGTQSIPQWRLIAARIQFPSGLMLCAAVEIDGSTIRSVLAFPWMLVTTLMALQALVLWRKNEPTFAEKISLLGWLQLPVGASWLLADFLQLQPMGFDSQIVRLTAAHFHFAGFVLPLLAGFLASNFDHLLVRIAAIGSALGVGLVATGITLTKLNFPPALESVLAALFCCFVLLLSVCQIMFATLQRSVLIFISGIALCVATIFALLYALRLWIPLPWLHIPRMWALHGSIQVFGFSFCGLIGWWRFTIGSHQCDAGFKTHSPR